MERTTAVWSVVDERAAGVTATATAAPPGAAPEAA
jgi:hypothetical protein